MSPRPSASLLALIVAVLLAPSLRAELNFVSLTPDEGSVGTELVFTFSGDLGKGKPKLWLTRHDDRSPKPKQTKLEISSIEDAGSGFTTVVAAFTKTKTGAGLYDVHAKPKGKGQVEELFESAFVMRAPVVDSVSPDTAPAKSEITVTGSFFGSRKPVVRFTPSAGGKSKKAKVTSVTGGDTLIVKLPKLGGGLHDLSVSTKVGDDVLVEALTALAPGVKDTFSACFASVGQSLIASEYLATGPNQPGSVLAGFHNTNGAFHTIIVTTAMQFGGGDEMGLSLSFPFDPVGNTTPFTFGFGAEAPNFNVVVHQEAPEADWAVESIGLVPGTLSVTSASAKRIAGTFEFTLIPAGSEPAADDLEITKGQFDVALQDA